MILVIETALSACSVALIDGAVIVAAMHEDVGRGHAERLLPLIAMLPEGGRAAAVLVDCGPGSFTGIRVGVAAARGLGFAWEVPVHGYSSLALLAAAHFSDGRGAPVTAAIPGGHGEVFVRSFAPSPVRATDQLASLLPMAASLRAQDEVIGAAASALVALRGRGTAFARALDARDAIWLAGDLSDLPPVPIYGRAADAKPMA